MLALAGIRRLEGGHHGAEGEVFDLGENARRSKSSFPIALICTTSRRITTSTSTNQGPQKGDLITMGPRLRILISERTPSGTFAKGHASTPNVDSALPIVACRPPKSCR